MLRWSTAAATCLILGGVRGAVMASSEEEASLVSWKLLLCVQISFNLHPRPRVARLRGDLWRWQRRDLSKRCSLTSRTPPSLGRSKPPPGGKAVILSGGENWNRCQRFLVLNMPFASQCDRFYSKSMLPCKFRSAGMSKAVFSLQRSVRFQRAVLFAMINPQVGFSSCKSRWGWIESLFCHHCTIG